VQIDRIVDRRVERFDCTVGIDDAAGEVGNHGDGMVEFE